MRKVIVFTNLTLDGVMQAPGLPDEDTRGGFPYGGWAAPYNAMRHAAGADLQRSAPLLMGRRTYENFYSFWPKQTDSPFKAILDNATKYVASRTMQEPLPWVNSVLLKGDAAQSVAEIKAQPGEDLLVMGSGDLIQTLRKHNLVDTYILLIHPLILGTGRKLFPDNSPYTMLRMVDHKMTPEGVIIATYLPAEERQQ